MPGAVPDWPGLVDAAVRGIGVRPVFQPIVDVANCVVAGYEALARFDLGPKVPPNVWFEQAAALGRVTELEGAVLGAVFARRETLPANTFLTVNIEPESLLSTDVMDMFRLHSPLHGIVVEITEHRELGDSGAVATALAQLRRSGALIAVDDAGAGYSGLQQILTLRPQILKLDRSLVEGLDTDESKTALVEMMGVFANRIDAWILAEGIETEGEARRCAALGVPLAQGWFYARPGPPWAGIDPAAVVRMAEAAGPSIRHGLRGLLHVAPSVEHDDMPTAAAALAAGTTDHVVITREQRPVGLLNLTAAMRGELLVPHVANIGASPHELAHRLATATVGDTFLPVVVTDGRGRYVGIVSMARLLGHLGSASPADDRTPAVS